MDEQMPRAVEEGAERAEEDVEQTKGQSGNKPSEVTEQGETDAACDVAEGK